MWSQGGSRDGSGCPRSAPWEKQGWVRGVLLWFPWLGSTFGTVLSRQCQVSSWLGVPSVSRGWRCQHPLHTGTATRTPRGSKGWVLPLSCLQPLQDRIPESSHLPFAPQRQRSRRAASSPLNGSFLAAATKSPLWGGGPGGRALASSPLVPCQPPPGGVRPCPPPARGQGGLAGGRIPGNGIWGGGRASTAVKGARLDVPCWQWGAVPWGQDPSRHGLSRIFIPPSSSQCHGKAGKCGSRAGGTRPWM